MTHPTTLTALEAIDALAAGHLSAVELTRAYLERIGDVGLASNAFLHLDTNGALDAAHASDLRRANGTSYHPLDGIPLAVSDNIEVAGMPLTAGMATRRRRIAQSDAHCIAKLRRAGVVILGKLNLDEAGFGSRGDNPHFGACSNPYGSDHSSGGAASGAAVAVALRLCALAIAVDGLGSLRVPAAFCGVAAFKPSHSRVSQRGLISVSKRLDQVGPVARSCNDLSVVFQQISGVDALDAQSRTVPLAHIERDPRRLTIGVIAELAAQGIAIDVIESFRQSVERLRGLLPIQDPIAFNDYDFGHKRCAAQLLCAAEMNLVHADDLATQPENFSGHLREQLAAAARASAVDLIAAEQRLDLARLKARRIFSVVDVLLTPTAPVAAFAWGTETPEHIADLSSFADFAGLPALSVPMGNLNGLPLGLQLVGPRGSDLQLLALGERIEAVLGRAATPPAQDAGGTRRTAYPGRGIIG